MYTGVSSFDVDLSGKKVLVEGTGKIDFFSFLHIEKNNIVSL